MVKSFLKFVKLNNAIILSNIFEPLGEFRDKFKPRNLLKLFYLCNKPMVRWTVQMNGGKHNFLNLVQGAKLEIFFETLKPREMDI